MFEASGSRNDRAVAHVARIERLLRPSGCCQSADWPPAASIPVTDRRVFGGNLANRQITQRSFAHVVSRLALGSSVGDRRFEHHYSLAFQK